MNDKQALRKRLKTLLSTISKQSYEHDSYMIAKALYNDVYWKEAKTIGITISNIPEVDTYQIIRRAWEEDKKVVTPKCFPDTKTMDFRILTAFNQLESVYYGLLEPIEGRTDEVEPSNIDLLIVPGLAFTRQGFRLGFGGGYYDRFLQSYKGKTLSLAFQSQIVESLPIEGHDIPVSRIITEQECIYIND